MTRRAPLLLLMLTAGCAERPHQAVSDCQDQLQMLADGRWGSAFRAMHPTEALEKLAADWQLQWRIEVDSESRERALTALATLANGQVPADKAKLLAELPGLIRKLRPYLIARIDQNLALTPAERRERRALLELAVQRMPERLCLDDGQCAALARVASEGFRALLPADGAELERKGLAGLIDALDVAGARWSPLVDALLPGVRESLKAASCSIEPDTAQPERLRMQVEATWGADSVAWSRRYQLVDGAWRPMAGPRLLATGTTP